MSDENQYAVWKKGNRFTILYYSPGWTEMDSPQFENTFFIGPCVYSEAVCWVKLMAKSDEEWVSVKPPDDNELTGVNTEGV